MSEKKETNKVEEVKETKVKSNWGSKIWSAVIGVIVGVAGMFGFTSKQISAEKAKVETFKVNVQNALYSLENGDVTTATANLKTAIATGTEVIKDVKAAAEKVKEADKNSVVETVKNEATKALVKDQVKKTEQAIKTYSEQKVAPVKKEDTKKAAATTTKKEKTAAKK